jgi:predicted nucleic acid-binding protein
MAQVIDASVAIAWCAPSQANQLTDAALNAVGEGGAHVPTPFWYEVLYGLAGLEFRGIVRRADVDDFLSDAKAMNLVVDSAPDTAGMVELHYLARRYSLSIFDAAYLDLAARLGLPLATRDATLARAAERAGVTLFTA